MSSAEAWVDAWLNYQPMPPNSFPLSLQAPMLDLADRWLRSNKGPRKQLEEFVTRKESYDVMDGLLYSGFCWDRLQRKRTPPIPVTVQLLYRTPPPVDETELKAVMIEVSGRALSEWCRLRLSGKGPLFTAP